MKNLSNVSKIIFDSEYLEDKGIGSLSDFVDRVKEIHAYNLEQYSDEKPTLEGSYRELLIDIVEDIGND